MMETSNVRMPAISLLTLNKTIMMMMLMLAMCLNTFVTVHAFPSGAGSCTGGKAAVGGPHTSTATGKTIKSNTLAAQKVTVTIAGKTYAAGTTISLKSNTNHAVKVSGIGMKGVLVRLSTGTITAGTNAQTASVCTSPVVGITHKSNTVVGSYGGTIKIPKATKGVTMDITIVYNANSKSSSYAYGKITVNFT